MDALFASFLLTNQYYSCCWLLIPLVVLVLVVVLVLDKLCFDALSSPSETSAPDRVFKL